MSTGINQRLWVATELLKQNLTARLDGYDFRADNAIKLADYLISECGGDPDAPAFPQLEPCESCASIKKWKENILAEYRELKPREKCYKCNGVGDLGFNGFSTPTCPRCNGTRYEP
jgi:DnaJ-class molecular chaperone